MTSRKITDLSPDLQPLCLKFMSQCHDEGINVILTQTYRSNAEQDALYAQGRTKPGKIVTNAKAGQSKHNIGDAFDVAIKNPDGSIDWNPEHPSWQRMGEIGRQLGLNWGGDWHSIKDYPHFEI